MFAATGWRVGWLIGPKSIIQPTLAATTRIVFCSNSPLQEGAAAGIEEARERKFFETQLQEYEERRQIMVDIFDKIGMRYTLPEGTYFILLVSSIFLDVLFVLKCSQDISKIHWPDDYPFPESVLGRGRDFRYE